MRGRWSIVAALAAGGLAAPACAQLFGIEELPVAADAGEGGADASGVADASDASDAADASDASDASDAWTPGACDCPATQDWSKAFASTGDVKVGGVAIDAADRVIIAGSIAGTLTIDGHALPGGADHDVFVIVLDACGDHVWARRFGDAGEQGALAVAVDPPTSPSPGAIVLTGAYTGALSFGGSAKGLSSPGQRAFIARLDPATGDGLASRDLGGDPAKSYQGTTVAVEPDGSAYWAGTEDSGAGLFVERLDPALTVTNQISPTCTQCAPRVARVPAGVVVAGSLQGSVDFAMGGPGPLTSSGGTDVYVAALTPQNMAFSEIKPKAYGDGAAQLAAGIAGDPATGEVLVAGAFAGTLSMGGGSKTRVSTGGLDAFVAKLDTTMSPQWLASFGGGGATDQQATAVALGSRIAVAGDFRGAMDPGADAGPTLTSAGDTDAFLLILDASSGALLAASSFGGAGADHGAAVAVDSSAHAIVAGVISGPADFGCGTLGGASPSIFVAKRPMP